QLPRMMPAVHFRAAHEIVQSAQTNVSIRVLEKTTDRIEHKIIGKYVGTDTEKNEWEAVTDELKGLFQRMEAKDVCRIELFRLMMERVQSPYWIPVVSDAMQPVTKEVSDCDFCQQLNPDRPHRRPDFPAEMFLRDTTLQEPNCQPAQRQRDHSLHAKCIEGVVGKVTRGR